MSACFHQSGLPFAFMLIAAFSHVASTIRQQAMRLPDNLLRQEHLLVGALECVDCTSMTTRRVMQVSSVDAGHLMGAVP